MTTWLLTFALAAAFELRSLLQFVGVSVCTAASVLR